MLVIKRKNLLKILKESRCLQILLFKSDKEYLVIYNNDLKKINVKKKLKFILAVQEIQNELNHDIIKSYNKIEFWILQIKSRRSSKHR